MFEFQYSSMLQKIFIQINTNFPVDFKWTPVDKKLFIRATPTYYLPQHNQDLVLRCMPHAQPTDASNLGQKYYLIVVALLHEVG